MCVTSCACDVFLHAPVCVCVCVCACVCVCVHPRQLSAVPIKWVSVGRLTAVAVGSGTFVWGSGDARNFGIPGVKGHLYDPALVEPIGVERLSAVAITDSMCCFLTTAGCVRV